MGKRILGCTSFPAAFLTLTLHPLCPPWGRLCLTKDVAGLGSVSSHRAPWDLLLSRPAHTEARWGLSMEGSVGQSFHWTSEPESRVTPEGRGDVPSSLTVLTPGTRHAGFGRGQHACPEVHPSCPLSPRKPAHPCM